MVGGTVIGGAVVVVDRIVGGTVVVVVGGDSGIGSSTGRGGFGRPSLAGAGPTSTAIRLDRAIWPATVGCTLSRSHSGLALMVSAHGATTMFLYRAAAA